MLRTVFPFQDHDTDCDQVQFVCVKPDDIVYPLDYDHLVGLYQSFRIIIGMIGGNEERNKYMDFFDTKGLQFSKRYADEKDW